MDEKAITELSDKLIDEAWDAIVTGMLTAGLNSWGDAAGKEEDPHVYTVVDIRLPSEDVKDMINHYIQSMSIISGWTPARIESFLFGKLIMEGLYVEAQRMGIKTGQDLIEKATEGMQRTKEVIDTLMDTMQ